MRRHEVAPKETPTFFPFPTSRTEFPRLPLAPLNSPSNQSNQSNPQLPQPDTDMAEPISALNRVQPGSFPAKPDDTAFVVSEQGK